MTVELKILRRGDERLLSNIAPGVFDGAINTQLSAEFVANPHHHPAVANDNGVIVGFATAVHYVHPDKRPELWINEIGVSPGHRRQGLATGLLRELFDAGRKLGCRESWVLTEPSNAAAVGVCEFLAGNPTDQVMYSFEI